jgi:uncharacterized OsmC-like protein
MMSRREAGTIFLWTMGWEKPEPKPIELVAATLAGFTAFDVITILRNKKHKTVTGYEVMVEADQRLAPPQVFTRVRIHHAISGNDIDEQSVKDAIQLSGVIGTAPSEP